ncbi:MAG: DNA helicase, partial [Gemmatimonadetes bacterium]|nr:DNA helicase [Gemmatimonadota bacterium]NIQ60291.1 DNA helicase [Gemmatimonadota bacterium]NIU80509.1 DNA helicase [Gammaproteobacteria bacterium]NIX48834.1 DNA helicase [Gemmatimonadota bacterium]NIY13283.1 DNA helicase [Gemmatimonadota bacterium]
MGLRKTLKALRDLYEALYIAPYRAQIHRQYIRQHDLFMLLTASDLLGVPNPVEFYTLELLP